MKFTYDLRIALFCIQSRFGLPLETLQRALLSMCGGCMKLFQSSEETNNLPILCYLGVGQNGKSQTEHSASYTSAYTIIEIRDPETL